MKLLNSSSRCEDLTTPNHKLKIKAIYQNVSQAEGEDVAPFMVIVEAGSDGATATYFCDENGQCDVYGNGERIIQVVEKIK